jgi:hypothetical protein
LAKDDCVLGGIRPAGGRGDFAAHGTIAVQRNGALIALLDRDGHSGGDQICGAARRQAGTFLIRALFGADP